MGGTREQGVETEIEVDVEVVVSATVEDHESFVEKMERAARGELGAFPADDPDLSGEDRFDAG